MEYYISIPYSVELTKKSWGVGEVGGKKNKRTTKKKKNNRRFRRFTPAGQRNWCQLPWHRI